MTTFEAEALKLVNDTRCQGYDPRLASLGEQQLVDGLAAAQQGRLRLQALVETTVSTENVADALLCMADMLGCPVPGPKGIDLFLLAVQDMPVILLPIATINVARTHRFMRMPLPADYLRSIEDHLAAIEATRSYLATFERICLHALELRHADAARFGDRS